MKFEFIRACKTPFSDDKWFIKMGILAILFIPAYISFFKSGTENNSLGNLLLLLANLIILGYSTIVAHNEIQNKAPILPDWNVSTVITNLIKYSVISIGYLLILIPLFLIAFGLLFANQALMALVIIILIPIVITYFVFTSIAFSLFYVDYNITDAFDFKKIFSFFKKGFWTYLLAFLLSIAAGLLYGIVSGIISGILNLFTPESIADFIITIASAFAVIISSQLIAQAYNITKQKV